MSQSCLSGNDKDINEMKLGAVNRSPGIYLTAKEYPSKPQLGGHLMKAMRPIIDSNGVLPQNEFCRIAQNIRNLKERKGHPSVHGAIGFSQKSFKLVWQCHQLLSGFLAKGYLPRVSHQSRQSLMRRVLIK